MHQQSHHQQHAQQAAAAAAAAQQAHFNRVASSASHANALNAVHQDPGADNPNMSEDNRRTMAYIADLLNENSREQALLELSKKREQVPELALILWHSFGAYKAAPRLAPAVLMVDRMRANMSRLPQVS